MPIDPAHDDPLSAASMATKDDLWQYWDQAMVAMRESMTSINTAINASALVSPGAPRHWLIDSGCSNHYTTCRHILSEFRDILLVNILTGNGHIMAKGIGCVTLHSSLGSRKLTDVMWIPDLAGCNNLLSIPQLVRKGCSVNMS